MKRKSYEVNGVLAVIVFVVVLASLVGIYALIIYGVSALVSYVFDIDFGFWKTAASLVLLSVVSAVLGANRAEEVDG